MSRLALTTLAALAALTATAPRADDAHRELGAHVHGIGALNIAVEGNEVAMELHVPGADIVGFEYAAETAEDKAKLAAAVAQLERPLELFKLPEAAGCVVTEAKVALETEAHDHDHGAEGHSAEAHAEADHDDHEEGAQHAEFDGDYLLTCGNPAALNRIEFAYFAAFPNARELDIQFVSGKGAGTAKVTRENDALDLAGMI
jgi:hypothetical protein